MSFKKFAEEILLIVDVMTWITFIYFYIRGVLIVSVMFFWIASFIITRYLSMKGWKKSINLLNKKWHKE